MDLSVITRIQIAWGQFSLLLGLVSNPFVLYATIAHNAIRLDKLSVWIINNLAVVDIMNTLIVLLPNLQTQYLGGKWVLGRDLCYAYSCCRFAFFVVNIFLIMVMSLNKLIRCLYPLRSLDSSKCQRIVITVAAAIVSALSPAWIAYGFKDGFYRIATTNQFEGSRNICKSIFSPDKAGEVKRDIFTILAVTLDVIPCLGLVVINSILVIYAIKKTNTTVNKRNLVVVITVTTCTLLAFIPLFVTMMFRRATSWAVDELAWSITFSSLWSNPIIYLAVNPAFREFAKNTICFWRPRTSVRRTSRVSVCVGRGVVLANSVVTNPSQGSESVAPSSRRQISSWRTIVFWARPS